VAAGSDVVDKPVASSAVNPLAFDCGRPNENMKYRSESFKGKKE
jgi:hypothetical protein